MIAIICYYMLCYAMLCITSQPNRLRAAQVRFLHGAVGGVPHGHVAHVLRCGPVAMLASAVGQGVRLAEWQAGRLAGR